jgi:hypothetical protein
LKRRVDKDQLPAVLLMNIRERNHLVCGAD